KQKLTVVSQLPQKRLRLVKNRLQAAAHQVERSLSRLRYAGSHARLQRLRAGLLRQFLYLNVNFRRDRSAVDEDFASGALQQVVLLLSINFPHRPVVRNHRDNNVRHRRHPSERPADVATQFLRERLRRFSAHVINRDHRIPDFLQSTRHVRAHPAHPDESNFFWHNRSWFVFLSATAERVAAAFNSREQFRANLNKQIELGTLFSLELTGEPQVAFRKSRNRSADNFVRANLV